MASIINSVSQLFTINDSKGKKGSQEIGESSQTICEICSEKKDNDQIFTFQNCIHRYCRECITNHSKNLQSVDDSEEFESCDEGFETNGVQSQEGKMALILKSIAKLFTKAENSSSSPTTCEICTERKENDQMFTVRNCCHRYCTECITRHIAVKLQESPAGNQEHVGTFGCPALNCRGVLEIKSCRKIFPKSILSMWDDMICESMIDPSQKFYYPYEDCSGLMVNDGSDGKEIRESECPFCHRLFCATCRVPWHSGIKCKEVSKMNKYEKRWEDGMVHELAKKKKWQRCPSCKFFVEKTEGCLHITCRCGPEFCYACGRKWSSTQGGCQ